MNDTIDPGFQIIPRQSLTMMAEAWQQAEADIREAYRLLEEASKRLQLVFSTKSYNFDFQIGIHSHNYDAPEDLIKRARVDAWRAITERMELRRIMSVKACAEMDKQLEHDELPEITAPNLIAMLEGTLAKMGQYMQDAVREVYDYLRPSPECYRFKEYKTNQKSQFELADRVIITGGVDTYRGGIYSVNHYRQDMIRAIDNVFHTLDGKGQIKTYAGELCDEINKCPKIAGVGLTTYFEFKCFKNGNLHLKFRRPDLVARLNQIAGGMTLKP